MRVLTGQQVMARVFFGESDRWGAQPLSTALVARLRTEGFSGATVFRGVAGFGAHSVVNTTRFLELSRDLPMVLEVVDTEERIERLLPILDEMVKEGLVTLEKVRVVQWAAGDRPKGE